MKNTLALFIFLLPLLIHGQLIHQLQQPAPASSKLLQLGEHTIMIHPMDLENSAHKWTTFDNALRQVALKKLVTPDAQHIISQSYLQSPHAILRIDQLFIEDQIYVTAYSFDAQGNLLHNQLLTTVPNETSEPIPFHIIQSPDKKYVGIVQPLILKQDSLYITSLVTDAGFKEINKATFTVPLDPILSEMHLPLLTNQAALTVPTYDRFDSYKLSSNVKLHLVQAGSNKPQTISIPFPRMKLRNYYFGAAGDSIHISALYSTDNKKKEVTGVVFAGINISNGNLFHQQAFAYSNEVKTQLNKQFLKDGREGSLLNYLALLPKNYTNNPTHNFATLLTTQDLTRMASVNKITSKPSTIHDVKHGLGHIQGLVGTTLRGTNTPMTFDQASTYAATVGAVSSNAPLPESMPYKLEKSHRDKIQKSKRTLEQARNMLYFSFKEKASENSFIKLQQPKDPSYSFTTYLPTSKGYSVVYYSLASKNSVALQQTTIESNGKVSTTQLMENPSLLLLEDYDVLISNNTLVGFYEDKFTKQMGLLKIEL